MQSKATGSPLPPQNIWHLISNPWHSAITEYALSAVEALASLGVYQQRLIVTQGSIAAEAARSRVPQLVETIPSFAPRYWPKLRRMIGRDSRTLIMCYGGPEHSFARIFFAKYHVRFRGEAPRGIWARLNIPSAGSCPTIYPSQRTQTLWGNAKSWQRVVPLGRMPSRYFEGTLEHSPKAAPEILMLGRLDPIKGHAQAIQSFAEAKRVFIRTHPDQAFATLRIVGEPKSVAATSLRTLADQLELGPDEVVLDTAWRSDVAQLLAQANLGWVSSLGSEWICRVAEEFLLAGTAVMVSQVGSLAEVIGHQEDGFSYAVEAIEPAAEALLKFRESWQSWSSIDQRTQRRQRATLRFSLEAMSLELKKALTSL